MVTAQDVSQAWTRIKPHVLRTPVLETDVFGMPLTLKLEQMQHTGSFKARGAMNSLLSMDGPKPALSPPAAAITALPSLGPQHAWATEPVFMCPNWQVRPKSI